MRGLNMGAITALGFAAWVGACGRDEAQPRPAPRPPASEAYTVRDTIIVATFEAAGVAEPVQRATLSTRLMGSVTAVSVMEGDQVGRGQVLAKIDASDIAARRAQVEAGISAAEAVYQDALTQAGRFRALYEDSAATRYQLEQAETGLARAESGLRTARAARQELDAIGAYAEIRAPFAGIVTRRFVDVGAFVAPGAPVVEVQDASSLRVSVSVPPRVAATLRRGAMVDAAIEGRVTRGKIEGVVPSSAGAVYTVNALVANAGREFLPGSAATLRIPDGERPAVLVPAPALVRQGELIGVRIETASGFELRWVQAGAVANDMVEVYAGLRGGDRILVGGE